MPVGFAQKLGRRRLLVGGSALVAGVALAGCTPVTPEASTATPPPPTPDAAIPAAGQPAAPIATAGSGELSLDEFLALSSQLTAFPTTDLSRDLASLYLGSLQAVAPPEDLRALATATDSGPLGDTLINYWYSGVYETPNGPAVATYTDALAWKSVGYTPAPTVCRGETGYWSEAPQAD
jgi:hypothetical protein